ncbi:MAG TPA: hypothetical protein VMT35_01150, partial [Ignavibacteriaceae bacterium]|nr:hypothetical protein [Ignavibacteriaceae bacterium]
MKMKFNILPKTNPYKFIRLKKLLFLSGRGWGICSLIIFYLIPFTYSQTKVGTTIGQFLKIEPSSRLAAIGNAGTSLSDEASAAFYNPASLGRIKGVDIQFTYNEWLADITFSYASAAVNLEGIG